MIILAHDGSLYGEWVSRYAINFALSEEDRRLLVLHVPEGKIAPVVVEARLERLMNDCTEHELSCRCEYLPPEQDVYRSLRHAIPHDPTALLVCGTRVKARNRAYLTDSIAEKLLRTHQCPVVALRVTQPGLLGTPVNLLLPLAGHDAGTERFWPVLRRFVPRLHSVQLFRSLNIHYLRYPHLSRNREQSLRDIGIAYLEQILMDIDKRLPERSFRIDCRVALSSNWSDEILVLASRLRMQLILLGVSERTLAHRLFYGVGLERILHKSPCDVGIYRGP
ncbi:MAG: universal stress protein [Desulfuromonadales bacterium]|nr:universal stress protein [Desulfuromonadales bacterium]MBN2793509.1 universal stress protein [Desulfuromonadales bacterium]